MSSVDARNCAYPEYCNKYNECPVNIGEVEVGVFLYNVVYKEYRPERAEQRDKNPAWQRVGIGKIC